MMEKLFEGLFSPYGIIVVLLVFIPVFVIIYKRGFRIEQRDGDVFQLGMNTPFEKTNTRFKSLCDNSAELKTKLDVIEAEMKSTRLDVLKLQITDEQLPPSYRLDAYDEYKQLGGNSWVDDYVKKYLKRDAADAMAHRLGGSHGTTSV
jgi:hypothetical protein